MDEMLQAATATSLGLGAKRIQEEMHIEQAWLRLAAVTGPSRFAEVKAEVERRVAFHVELSSRAALLLDPVAVIDSAAREVALGVL